MGHPAMAQSSRLHPWGPQMGLIGLGIWLPTHFSSNLRKVSLWKESNDDTISPLMRTRTDEAGYKWYMYCCLCHVGKWAWQWFKIGTSLEGGVSQPLPFPPLPLQSP